MTLLEVALKALVRRVPLEKTSTSSARLLRYQMSSMKRLYALDYNSHLGRKSPERRDQQDQGTRSTRIQSIFLISKQSQASGAQDRIPSSSLNIPSSTHSKVLGMNASALFVLRQPKNRK
jgi:hypothetical protein